MASLNIKKPETLQNRLETMEAQVLQAASTLSPGEKTQSALRINGKDVTFVVTPSIQPGRFYRLYYLDGKRTRRDVIPGRLLPVPA